MYTIILPLFNSCRLPRKRLLFTGTGSLNTPYCGWTNTTIRDACAGGGLTRPPQYQCVYHYFTHWCAIGSYTNGQINFSQKLVRGSLTRQERLPSFNSLTEPDPVPGQYSCTVASLGRGPVVWNLTSVDYLNDIFLRTDWPAIDRVSIYASETTFRLSLDNSALPGQLIGGIGAGTTSLTPYLPDFEPTRTFETMGLPSKNVLDCKVRFDPTTGYLEVNSSWYCNDKKPSSP
jgi:hypothetical protein